MSARLCKHWQNNIWGDECCCWPQTATQKQAGPALQLLLQGNQRPSCWMLILAERCHVLKSEKQQKFNKKINIEKERKKTTKILSSDFICICWMVDKNRFLGNDFYFQYSWENSNPLIKHRWGNQSKNTTNKTEKIAQQNLILSKSAFLFFFFF